MNRYQIKALKLALTCVRNTQLEDIHAAGKITDEEMKPLMKEIVNKVYTFLLLERDFMENPWFAPEGWDEPEPDRKLILELEASQSA